MSTLEQRAGLRLVETCATCKHESRRLCRKHGFGFVSSNAHMYAVCNDHKGISPEELKVATAGLSDVVPVVGTPAMHWAHCASCDWSGWDTQLELHELVAGGADIWSTHCPRCGTEIARPSERSQRPRGKKEG